MNSSRIQELKRSAADEPAKTQSSPTVSKFPNVKIPPKRPERTTFAKPCSGRHLTSAAKPVSSTATAEPKPAPAVAAAEPKPGEPVTATDPVPKGAATEPKQRPDVAAAGQELFPAVAPPSTPPRRRLILVDAGRSPVKPQRQPPPVDVTASMTTLADVTKPPPTFIAGRGGTAEAAANRCDDNDLLGSHGLGD